MKRYFLIALTATMLAFASGSAFADNGMSNDGSNGSSNNDTFSTMDADGDGQVSASEFHNFYDDADVFDLWDANSDGWIDDDEFGDGLYGYYDDDDDGYISDAEWENGIMVDDYGDNGFWDI